jgi:outer membrane murein-binding lipoprotein Lpp
MNLYDIDNAILSCVDMETGEIIDAEKLDELKMEKERKIRNIACWVKELNAEAEALKKQKDAFAAREKVAKNKAEGLKAYLSSYLGGKEVKGTEYQISFRASQATEITDEEVIPPAYRIPQPDKLDKDGLLKALKGGAVIPGVQLIERKNIQIK